MKTIFENEKWKWYTTEQTILAAEYMKSKGLKDYFVALAEMKEDQRQEYVLLRADETGKTEAVFASSAMGEIVNQIDALSNLNKNENE
jgi:hypothetical protein